MNRYDIKFFPHAREQDDLIQLWNKRINSLNSDFSQIFIILIEISSWPWALCMFKSLIILRISSSTKSKEHSLDSRKTWFIFMGVHSSAKNLLEIFAFFLTLFTNLPFTKRRGISGIFFLLKIVSRIYQFLFVSMNGLFFHE